jgi:hypothetical protein
MALDPRDGSAFEVPAEEEGATIFRRTRRVLVAEVIP